MTSTTTSQEVSDNVFLHTKKMEAHGADGAHTMYIYTVRTNQLMSLGRSQRSVHRWDYSRLQRRLQYLAWKQHWSQVNRNHQLHVEWHCRCCKSFWWDMGQSLPRQSRQAIPSHGRTKKLRQSTGCLAWTQHLKSRYFLEEFPPLNSHRWTDYWETCYLRRNSKLHWCGFPSQWQVNLGCI